jgi:cytoskeletal protein RodZ
MKDVGILLQKARKSKNLTIDKVNQDTRIPKKYIEAIENGDLSKFPAEVYYTGNLRRYALYLGLNPAEFIEQFQNSKITPAGVTKQQETGEPRKLDIQFILVAVGSFLILILFIFALKMAEIKKINKVVVPSKPVVSKAIVPEAKPEQENEEQAEEAPSKAAPKKVAAPQKKAQTESAPTKEVVPAKLKLDITCLSSTWVRVMADNAMVFEGILSQGNTSSWPAQDNFVVKVGYTPGVRIKLNGKDIDVSKGSKQEVNEIFLNKESLK